MILSSSKAQILTFSHQASPPIIEGPGETVILKPAFDTPNSKAICFPGHNSSQNNYIQMIFKRWYCFKRSSHDSIRGQALEFSMKSGLLGGCENMAVQTCQVLDTRAVYIVYIVYMLVSAFATKDSGQIPMTCLNRPENKYCQ